MALGTAKEFSSADNTVIGQSILINGKLTGDEDLTVQGRVEGEISLTRTLIVEPSGIVKADVEVKNAIISGVVVGNITATESVELTKEGRMVGDIHSPRVIIVDGASFRGRVDMGNAEPGRAAQERPKAVVRPVVRSTPPVAATPAAPKAVAKPAPPPPPSASTAPKAAAPKPPPAPALVEAGKKKVIIKKKVR